MSITAFIFDLLTGVAVNVAHQALASTVEAVGGRRNHDFEAVIQVAVIQAAKTVARIRPGSVAVMDRLVGWAKEALDPAAPHFPADLKKACLLGDAEGVANVLIPQFQRVRVEVLADELVGDIEARLPEAVLVALGETLRDKKHEKGLIAFQRECSWDLSQRVKELGSNPPPPPPDEVVLSKAFLTLVREIDAAILHAVKETRDLAQTVLVEQRAGTERAEERHEQTTGALVEISARIASLSQAQPGERVKWTIPPPSAYFTGQDEYLEQVKAVLAGGQAGGITQPAGLKGLGGIGKTEIALAYAYRHALEFDEAHFIVAESLATLEAGLAQLVVPVGGEVPAGEEVSRLKAGAVRHLASLDRALVVFDNVDDIVGEKEFLDVLAGLGKAHVVITCRHPNMGDRIRAVPIDKMDEQTGALYVLRLGKGNEANVPWAAKDFDQEEFDEAMLLCRDLDGLPLALHHAGAMIRGEMLTVTETRAVYASNRGRLLKNRDACAGSTHPDSVWVTTQLALEKLQAADPAAAELVVCCAFLAPEAMIESLFTGEQLAMREPLASSLATFAAHRATAIRSALIERVSGERRLAMHRVTQAIIQDLQGAEAKARFMEVGNRATLALLQAVAYGEAAAQAEATFAGMQRVAEPKAPDTLVIMANLAEAYRSVGRYLESLRLYEETLRFRREVLGERHPLTLASFGNLASSYRLMGRDRDALELEEETLALMRDVLGERHPYTLTCMGHLAGAYREMGHFEEARELHDETLQLMREVLGNKHPHTLICRNNMALTYHRMKLFEEARELQEETLRLMRQVVGERHPDTLTGMGNLASTYREMGRAREALELEEEALRLMREVLGEHHPGTLTIMNNLALTLCHLGRVAEAEALLVQTLAWTNEVLGPDHPGARQTRESLTEIRRRRKADAITTLTPPSAEN